MTNSNNFNSLVVDKINNYKDPLQAKDFISFYEANYHKDEYSLTYIKAKEKIEDKAKIEQNRRNQKYSSLMEVANNHKKEFKKKRRSLWIWSGGSLVGLTVGAIFGDFNNPDTENETETDTGDIIAIAAISGSLFATIMSFRKLSKVQNEREKWKSFEKKAQKFKVTNVASVINALDQTYGFQLVIKF